MVRVRQGIRFHYGMMIPVFPIQFFSNLLLLEYPSSHVLISFFTKKDTFKYTWFSQLSQFFKVSDAAIEL